MLIPWPTFPKSTDFTNHPLNSHFSQSSFHSGLSSPLCPVQHDFMVPSYQNCWTNSSFHPFCPMCSVSDHFSNFSIWRSSALPRKISRHSWENNTKLRSSLFLVKSFWRRNSKTVKPTWIPPPGDHPLTPGSHQQSHPFATRHAMMWRCCYFFGLIFSQK